jgi:hypothetical protein
VGVAAPSSTSTALALVPSTLVRAGPKLTLEIEVPDLLIDWVQSPAGLAELADIKAKTGGWCISAFGGVGGGFDGGFVGVVWTPSWLSGF